MAALALIMYALGVPVLLYMRLREHRAVLRSPAAVYSLGFLYRDYKDEFCYWVHNTQRMDSCLATHAGWTACVHACTICNWLPPAAYNTHHVDLCLATHAGWAACVRVCMVPVIMMPAAVSGG